MYVESAKGLSNIQQNVQSSNKCWSVEGNLECIMFMWEVLECFAFIFPLQRRSNYQNTRDKIASHASELASSSAASPTRTASSSEEDPLMEPDASKGASSSSLNKSNEENIDPTYQIPADGDHSDEDVFAAVTPSKPSTSHGHANGGPPGEKNLTPLTRSEKGMILWIWENTCIIYWYIVISACLIYSLPYLPA